MSGAFLLQKKNPAKVQGSFLLYAFLFHNKVDELAGDIDFFDDVFVG